MSLRSVGSIAVFAAGAFVCVATSTLLPRMAIAQPSSVTRGDIEQLEVDLKVGMEHSHLTPQEKGRMRGDLEQLREARQNHEPLKGFETAGRIREMVENDSFRQGDQDRIQSDMEAIRESRQLGDPLTDYNHWWNGWNGTEIASHFSHRIVRKFLAIPRSSHGLRPTGSQYFVFRVPGHIASHFPV